MWRAASLENILMLGKIEDQRRRRMQRIRWLDSITDSMDMNLSKVPEIGASLVAQLVKNPPAMWETWVLSLGWEDPLEKGRASHSSILAWRIPWGCRSIAHGVTKSWTWLSDFSFHQLVGGILLESAPGKSALGQEHLDFRHKCPCHHCTLKS